MMRRLSLLALLAGVAGCAPDQAVAPGANGSGSSLSAPPLPATPGTVNTGSEGEFVATDTVFVLKRTSSLAQDLTASAVIGPEGGEIKIDAAGGKIVFPVGALEKPTLITMTAKAGWNVAYEFEPHGIRFGADVKIQQDLKFTMAYHQPSLVEKLQGAYYKNLDASFIDPWKLLALVREVCPTEVDKANPRIVKFYIRHFSGYLMSSGLKDRNGGWGGDGW